MINNKFNIIFFPNKILKTHIDNISISKENLNFIKDNSQKMFDIMFDNNGIGLAANQLGIKMRFFIMLFNNKNIIAINPKITKCSGILYEEEGCLSIPGIYSKVKRYENITMTAINEYGMNYEINSNGINSICIQHEIDHLNGILYIDHLSRLKREFMEKKFVNNS